MFYSIHYYSDSNHYCCRDCKIAAANYKCYSSPNYVECFEAHSFCDGKSKDCPGQKPKKANSACNSADYGRCSETGQCLSLCQQRDLALFPCKCTQQAEKCQICCRNIFENKTGGNDDDDCRPISDIYPKLYSTPLFLTNGRACFDGLCENVSVACLGGQII
jgi:hypothetical protein